MVPLNIDLSFNASLFPIRSQTQKHSDAEICAMGNQSCASRHSIDIQLALDPSWIGIRWKTNGQKIDMTKNYTDEWVGDATIADAILDRLMQQNHRLTLTGKSLRQKPKPILKEKNTEPS